MLAAELGVNIDTSAARGEGIADASTLLMDRQATAAAAGTVTATSQLIANGVCSAHVSRFRREGAG